MMMTRRDLLLGRSRPDQGEVDLLSDTRGAAAIEYGLIGGLIAVVLTASLTRLGKRQRRNMRCVNRAMKGREANRFCKRRGA